MRGCGINSQRLIRDLRDLSSFGAVGKGVTRLSYSPADVEARLWLLRKMSDAGLQAWIDEVGNVYGRSLANRAILLGSHTDTVPQGGWLDGSLGVIYALEIARCMRESGAPVGVDVVSFVEEEGTYLSWFGSRHFCGDIGAEQINAARSEIGRPLVDALKEFAGALQKAGVACAPAHLDRNRHVAYLEAHIEQGPRLEVENKKIGAVTGIVGIRNRQICFQGASAHAGTTPMSLRRDACGTMIRFACSLLDEFERSASPNTVWNIGYIRLEPGRRNVVPGKSEFSLQYRDPSSETLAYLDKVVTESIAAANRSDGVVCSSTTGFSVEPLHLDPRLSRRISEAADALDVPWIAMPSGAGHDAAALARHLPAGLLFVPSIGGHSHTTEENTSDDDIVLGAEVMLEAVSNICIQGSI
jgi:N-carbamoyl-L-amino-acid hydrolase